MDFAGEFQQYVTSTIRTSGGSGVRWSWASLARTFLSDPSAPKTHEKMAFTVAPSISRRPIASAGGPLALLNLLRDGKVCLETSTCRLTPLHPWLTIIYVSPDWGQGAICRSRSYQIVFLPRIGWKSRSVTAPQSPIQTISVPSTYVFSPSFEMRGGAKSSVLFSPLQIW